MEIAGFILVLLALWAILVFDRPQAVITTPPTHSVVRMAGSNGPKLTLDLLPSILAFAIALMLAITAV